MQDIKRNFGGIDVTIRRNNNQKNMYVKVFEPDGHILITAPAYMSLFEIEMSFMNDIGIEKAKKMQQETINAAKEKGKPLLEDGSKLSLLGKKYTIRLKYNENVFSAEIDGDDFIVEMPHNIPYDGKEKFFYDCCRAYLKQCLPSFEKMCEEKTGLHANEYRIKLMKTRWGSCNTKDKRVWLNLRLVFYDEFCLEYVIIHELTHLLVPNHSEEFYAQIEKFFPDYKIAEKRLKERIKYTVD